VAAVVERPQVEEPRLPLAEPQVERPVAHQVVPLAKRPQAELPAQQPLLVQQPRVVHHRQVLADHRLRILKINYDIRNK
jgi:hypothetical protein